MFTHVVGVYASAKSASTDRFKQCCIQSLAGKRHISISKKCQINAAMVHLTDFLTEMLKMRRLLVLFL